jgi:hypothetical protein
MEKQYLIFISIYLLIGLLSIFFYAKEAFIIPFKDEDLKNDFFRKSIKFKLQGIFLILLYYLVFIFVCVLYPLVFLVAYLIDVREKKQNNSCEPLEYTDKNNFNEDTPRIYNPGYDKLIFSLINRYLGEQTHEISLLKEKYNQYKYLGFPIIYNYKLLNDIILSGSFRVKAEENDIGIFIFETVNYCDPPGESIFDVFPNLSNTNYAFRTYDQEITGSALSSILNIEVDGIDKFVFWKKDNLNELIIIPLNEFNSGFDMNIIIQSYHHYSRHKVENILTLLAEYLSLHWKNSKMLENEALRVTSKSIRDELFKRCYDTKNQDIINLLKIVEYRKPYVLYKRRLPDEEELKIRELTLIQPLDQIHKKYPEYDMNILKQFKSIETNNKLRKLENETNIDYRAKIFLKSANMINNLFDDEEIDFSAVTIGYSKFFEREINLSIVQLIRKELGINMPNYYEAYCDRSGQYIVQIGDDFKVNFNMQDRSNGKYLPPGLGQSLICYNSMADKLSSFISKYNELIKEGKKLNSIRNKSAHPDLINKYDVKGIKEILVQLYLNGILEQMFKTKVQLKNQ